MDVDQLHEADQLHRGVVYDMAPKKLDNHIRTVDSLEGCFPNKIMCIDIKTNELVVLRAHPSVFWQTVKVERVLGPDGKGRTTYLADVADLKRAHPLVALALTSGK